MASKSLLCLTMVEDGSPSNWRKHQYKLSRKADLAVGTASLTTSGAWSLGGPEGLWLGMILQSALDPADSRLATWPAGQRPGPHGGPGRPRLWPGQQQTALRPLPALRGQEAQPVPSGGEPHLLASACILFFCTILLNFS